MICILGFLSDMLKTISILIELRSAALKSLFCGSVTKLLHLTRNTHLGKFDLSGRLGGEKVLLEFRCAKRERVSVLILKVLFFCILDVVYKAVKSRRSLFGEESSL